MSPDEKMVANAAIKNYDATRYEQIYEEVSAATGINQAQVESLIERLASEGVLKKCGGPAHQVPGPDVGKPAKAWYEQGEMWRG